MTLSDHKTKIVCTIGPATNSEATLKALLEHGMNVARLNFSHGTFEEHRETIQRIRTVAAEVNRECLLLVDLPGPKIRIGEIPNGPIMLNKGEHITLTTQNVPGTTAMISVNYDRLPDSVSSGGLIYLNDGFIQLKVLEIEGTEVHCQIEIGGELRSNKGLNLPNARIFVDAITKEDLASVEFALGEGISTFAASFIEKADDIRELKTFAKQKGHSIFTVAKIERIEALKNFDEILAVTDGVMIARGDLGVQVPIEEVPGIQKELIRKANLRGCPVITATQMLESMIGNIRPTRAEVTDVANAILDGTDAVMLSAETAIGQYPVETVTMMAKIAASIEGQRTTLRRSSEILAHFKHDIPRKQMTVGDVISLNVMDAAQTLPVRYILTPTTSGTTPRRISRFKPDCWILAFTGDLKAHQFLALSYGVQSVPIEPSDENWHDAIMTFLQKSELARSGEQVIITEGVSSGQTGWTNSLKIVSV